MKVFTYSEARQKLSTVLDLARSEEVMIKRRGGAKCLQCCLNKRNNLLHLMCLE